MCPREGFAGVWVSDETLGEFRYGGTLRGGFVWSVAKLLASSATGGYAHYCVMSFGM